MKGCGLMKNIDGMPDYDLTDLSDIPYYNKYIEPLFDNPQIWCGKQFEPQEVILAMQKIMLDDGKSPYYIAKVSGIARERMWEYAKQNGCPAVI